MSIATKNCLLQTTTDTKKIAGQKVINASYMESSKIFASTSSKSSDTDSSSCSMYGCR